MSLRNVICTMPIHQTWAHLVSYPGFFVGHASFEKKWKESGNETKHISLVCKLCYELSEPCKCFMLASMLTILLKRNLVRALRLINVKDYSRTCAYEYVHVYTVNNMNLYLVFFYFFLLDLKWHQDITTRQNFWICASLRVIALRYNHFSIEFLSLYSWIH